MKKRNPATEMNAISRLLKKGLTLDGACAERGYGRGRYYQLRKRSLAKPTKVKKFLPDDVVFTRAVQVPGIAELPEQTTFPEGFPFVVNDVIMASSASDVVVRRGNFLLRIGRVN